MRWLGAMCRSPPSILNRFGSCIANRSGLVRNRRGSMGRAWCVTIACGLNVGDVSNVRRYARAQGDVTLTARSALGNAEPVSSRHQRDARRIRLAGILRQRQPFTSAIQVGHHANARQRAARRRGQCPKPRHDDCAVGAQRRGIGPRRAQRDDPVRDGRHVTVHVRVHVTRFDVQFSPPLPTSIPVIPRRECRAHLSAHVHAQPGRSDPLGRARGRPPGVRRGSLCTSRLLSVLAIARGTERRAQT